MEQQWTSEARYSHLLYRLKARKHRVPVSSIVLCGQSMTVLKFMLQNDDTALRKAALKGYVEVAKTLA